MKRFLLALALAFALTCGCCGLLVKLVDVAAGDLDALVGATHDLGTVEVPPGTSEDPARRFRWDAVTLSPRTHEVGYALASPIADALTASHEALAEQLHYRQLGEDVMAFEAPEGCVEHLGCIYDALADTNASSVLPLSRRFAEDIRARELSMKESAELVVAFVQSLAYRIPEDAPFGVLPPALVLKEGWGDCDSKALLAVMMLETLGIEAVVLTSATFKHAAIGLALPGSDRRFRFEGRPWQYAELTVPGWPIGMVPPEVDMPQFWEAVPRGRDSR